MFAIVGVFRMFLIVSFTPLIMVCFRLYAVKSLTTTLICRKFRKHLRLYKKNYSCHEQFPWVGIKLMHPSLVYAHLTINDFVNETEIKIFSQLNEK